MNNFNLQKKDRFINVFYNLLPVDSLRSLNEYDVDEADEALSHAVFKALCEPEKSELSLGNSERKLSPPRSLLDEERGDAAGLFMYCVDTLFLLLALRAHRLLELLLALLLLLLLIFWWLWLLLLLLLLAMCLAAAEPSTTQMVST